MKLNYLVLNRTKMLTCLLVVFMLSIPVMGFAETDWNVNEEGLALNGFDPVAYLKANTAVMGSSDYQYEWEGAIWQFSSSDHLDMFKSNPREYSPQYNGFCAYSLIEGESVKGNPDAYLIVDEKYYLFFDQDSRDKFKENLEENISKADHH